MSRPTFSGPCYDCCGVCEAPLVSHCIRTQTFGKVFYEVAGISGGNPKFYLIDTQSWADSYDYDDGSGDTLSWSFSTVATYTYDPTLPRASNAVQSSCSGSGSVSEAVNDGDGTSGTVSVSVTQVDGVCSEDWTASGAGALDGWNSPGSGTNNCDEPSGELPCFNGPATCNSIDNPGCVNTYSSEYTTAMLLTDTLAQLEANAYSGCPPGGGSFTNGVAIEMASAALAMDDSVYAIQDGYYFFIFKPTPTGYYKITWDEVFTPDGGGSPTISTKSFTWDGTTPSGYNAGDYATWPSTGHFTVTVPTSNGVVTIQNSVYVCAA